MIEASGSRSGHFSQREHKIGGVKGQGQLWAPRLSAAVRSSKWGRSRSLCSGSTPTTRTAWWWRNLMFEKHSLWNGRCQGAGLRRHTLPRRTSKPLKVRPWTQHRRHTLLTRRLRWRAVYRSQPPRRNRTDTDREEKQKQPALCVEPGVMPSHREEATYVWIQTASQVIVRIDVPEAVGVTQFCLRSVAVRSCSVSSERRTRHKTRAQQVVLGKQRFSLGDTDEGD